MPTLRRRILIASLFAGLVGNGLLASPYPQSHRIPAEQLNALQAELPQMNELMALAEIIQPIGLLVANAHSFPDDLGRIARSELDFGDRLTVLAVVKGSLGEQLGFLPGDVLMELNSFYVPKGKSALEQLHARILPKIDWEEPLSAMILRGGYGRALEAPSGGSLAKSEQP